MRRFGLFCLLVVALGHAANVPEAHYVHFAQRLFAPFHSTFTTDSKAFGLLRLNAADNTVDVALHWRLLPTDNTVTKAAIYCSGGPTDIVPTPSIALCDTASGTCASPIRMSGVQISSEIAGYLTSNNCYWALTTSARAGIELRAQVDGFAPGVVAGYAPPAGSTNWVNNFWTIHATDKQADDGGHTPVTLPAGQSMVAFVTKKLDGVWKYHVEGVHSFTDAVAKIRIFAGAPGAAGTESYVLCDTTATPPTPCPAAGHFEVTVNVDDTKPIDMAAGAYARIETATEYIARGQLNAPVNLLKPKFDEAYPAQANFRFTPLGTSTAQGVGMAWILPGVHTSKVKISIYHTVVDATVIELRGISGKTYTLCNTKATCAPDRADGSPDVMAVRATLELAQGTEPDYRHYDLIMAGTTYLIIGTAASPNGVLRADVDPAKNAATYATECTNDQAMVWLTARNKTATGGIFLINRLGNDTQIFGLHNVPKLMKFHIHTGAGVNNTLSPSKPYSPCNTVTECADYKGFSSGLVNDTRLLGTATSASLEWDKIEAGNAYVNVHSNAYPDGESHGQITKVVSFKEAGPAHYALKFIPNNGVTTSNVAYGVVRAQVRAGKTWAEVDVFHNITTATNKVTQVHLHAGARYPAVAALNKITVCDDAGVTPCNQQSYRFSLSDIDLNRQGLTGNWPEMMRTGLVYVQIHTVSHPDGELRAQLDGRASPALFTAQLSNRQAATLSTGKVPATPTGGVFLFTRANNKLIIQGIHNVPNPTKMHIHGPAEVSQGTAAHLYPDPDDICSNSSPLDNVPSCPAPGQAFWREVRDLNTSIVDQGWSFLNVHSQALPGGESAGQIVRLRRMTYDLSGASALGLSLPLTLILAVVALAVMW